MAKLETGFYLREQVVDIAKELLGKTICTRIDGTLTTGLITETEAYAGVTDRASHAFGDRRTERTEVMYRKGGVAYVYLCYGIHHLFNFVTGKKHEPHAVLLRGIFPQHGLETMEYRRSMEFRGKGFSDGPGKVTQALGIRVDHNGTNLMGNTIWIEDTGRSVNDSDILTGPRIGVDYAGADALLPYRFLLKDPERYK